MQIGELPTPCLIVDHGRLASNLARLQARADRQGVALRPHVKTHKSIAVARRQRELGARGLTAAKPSEAEVFVEAGFDDVRLAYPIVGEEKLARLARLMERARISFCVDSWEGASAASRFFSERGDRAEVLLKVDCGYGRVGVPWNDPSAADFARSLRALEGLRLVGLLTHAGQSYHGPADGESARQALQRVSADERDRMLELGLRLVDAGIFDLKTQPPEISVGSTPTAAVFESRSAGGLSVTEIRPGTYAYQDLTQVALGATELEECALTVLATVVSRRQVEGGVQIVLDAGKKVLTSDQRWGGHGFGLLLADPAARRGWEGAEIHTLSEEHAWVHLEGPPAAAPAIGERIQLVPNHVCVAVSTQDELHLVEGETVIETLRVDARGKVV